jgi:hypothetical protein
MATLMSFNFYNTGSNWFSNTPWNISATPDPNYIWGICDGETLPLLQCWFNCGGKKSSPAENPEENHPAKQNRKSEFYVFPNPTDGKLVVSSEYSVEGIEIFDIMGRKCYVSRVTCNENTIDISHLPTGMYFIRIQTDNGAEVQKIVKK